jgi:hypothetical protein
LASTLCDASCVAHINPNVEGHADFTRGNSDSGDYFSVNLFIKNRCFSPCITPQFSIGKLFRLVGMFQGDELTQIDLLGV